MKRILIVDDDELGARLVRRVLARQGYECKARRATDGLSIRDSSAPPDLIILDYLLPDMNGRNSTSRRAPRDFKALYCS
jgi:CheY-like chemotaxis protein